MEDVCDLSVQGSHVTGLVCACKLGQWLERFMQGQQLMDRVF